MCVVLHDRVILHIAVIACRRMTRLHGSLLDETHVVYYVGHRDALSREGARHRLESRGAFTGSVFSRRLQVLIALYLEADRLSLIK